jgi:hypothetical protein
MDALEMAYINGFVYEVRPRWSSSARMRRFL